jgi:uncharacterized protein (DUF2062 family)
MHKRPGRALKFYVKLTRHPGTPESVGRGAAAGLFTAFIIPAGHMLAAFPVAMLVRGTRSVALLLTWIVNPLTISIIYPAQCWLGSYIIGKPLSYETIHRMVSRITAEPSFEALRELGGDIIASFFAGGVLLGTVAATAGYFSATALVKRHRGHKADKKARRGEQFKMKECQECD